MATSREEYTLTIVILALIVCFIKRQQNERNNLLK
nr:MAG TPA: hypothetical protein [Caudoviricetes sp.]